MTFGNTSSLGLGNYAITGAISGTGSINKTGTGTLILSPTSTAGFSGTIRISGGSLRVTSGAQLGTNSGTGTNSAIDLAGDNAVLEIRSDAPTIGKNVYNRSGGSPIIFVDHAIGSSVINATATFGDLTFDANETLTFNGRNGFGATFGVGSITGGGVTTFANNLNGLLTFTGDFWNNTNNTGARTMTFSGNGSTTITGSIIGPGSSSFGHSLVKSGTGTLTINGSASNYTGNTTVAGTISMGNLGAVNKTSTTGSILLNTGTFQYTGAAADSMPKPFSLVSTTGSNAIVSDGAGTLSLSGIVGAGGVGAKTLYLGGTNTGDNTFSSWLLDNNSTNTTGLAKIGVGTWVLAEPTMNVGTATTVTIAAPGTDATTLLTLSTGNTANLRVGQTITIGATSAQITGIIDNTRFTVGVAFTTTTAPAGTYNVSTIPTTSTATTGGTWSGALTISNGTLKLAATNAASNIVSNGNAVVFNVDGFNANQVAGGTLEFVGVSGNATTETLGALTPTAGMNTVRITSGGGGAAANLVFSSLGAVGKGSGVNFVTTAGGGGTVTINGVLTSTATTLAGNGHFYINGANFARSNGGVLVAPVYGTDAGFVTSATALTAANNNEITGSFTNGAVAVTSLKISGGHTLTLSGDLTVNTGGVANDGGILQTGGSATIVSNNATVRAITTGGAGTVVIRVNEASDVLTLSSTAIIGSTTTGGLTKNGLGTLVISGVNAQTGATTINEGTVRLVTGGVLSANSAELVIRQGAILDLNGVSTSPGGGTTSSIGAFNGAGTITNSSTTAATLVVGGGNGTGTFSGSINDGAGVVNVTKNNTGGQTWSGISNYTGVTTIGSSGLVSVPVLANINVPSGIGRGLNTSDATNAASLVFTGTIGGINYTGLTSISIDRLFTFNGSAAGSGGQIANASANNSALIFEKFTPIAFGPSATVAQVLTLGGASTGDNQINLQIVDNGSLATRLSKIGVGLWILGNSANSYTGTTTITDGFLVAKDYGTLPNKSGVILGGTTTSGVLQSTGEFTRVLAASASAGENTVSWNTGLTSGGGGFAASSGKLIVAIGGLSTPSTLTWNVGGFMGTSATTTGPLVLNSATALGEVEIRNSIDLNGATRTITVNDNTSTFTDFATITGVISGTGNLIKNGAGTLQLLGANTYVGRTQVTTAAALVVTSLGNSALTGGSGLGANAGANTQSQALELGNAGTTGGVIQYIGEGEVSDRMIRLNTTTGSNQIHADGTGALILTNVVNDMVAGNKVLFLRGSNVMGNMITSTLANMGGTLGITADNGATWILSGNNTYTGTTSITAGTLAQGTIAPSAPGRCCCETARCSPTERIARSQTR
ncbi:MAG: autotransporter-associated beta strand repeat-containing protein [Pirellulales bacterium]